MNWKKLKEKFPNSYSDIWEFSKQTGLSGQTCLRRFLESKEYPDFFLRINQLKDYEEGLNKT